MQIETKLFLDIVLQTVMFKKGYLIRLSYSFTATEVEIYFQKRHAQRVPRNRIIEVAGPWCTLCLCRIH